MGGCSLHSVADLGMSLRDWIHLGMEEAEMVFSHVPWSSGRRGPYLSCCVKNFSRMPPLSRESLVGGVLTVVWLSLSQLDDLQDFTSSVSMLVGSEFAVWNSATDPSVKSSSFSPKIVNRSCDWYHSGILKISQGRGQGSLRKKHKVSLNFGSNHAAELLAFSLCQNDSKEYTGPGKKSSQELIGLETLRQSKVFCFRLLANFIHTLPSTETRSWERILDTFLTYAFSLNSYCLKCGSQNSSSHISSLLVRNAEPWDTV